jgi:hypothetical protein
MQFNQTFNLADDKDQKRAYQEIVDFCHGFELSTPDYYDLTHVMMAMAIQGMDYDDPRDGLRDIYEDALRARKIRLTNFMDFTFEYAGKRLALAQDEDRYIEDRMKVYLGTKARERRLSALEGTAFAQRPDMEEFLSAFEELQENLLMRGISRLSLAKAFLDACFVMARMCPIEEYESFCSYICVSLDPAPPQQQAGHESLDEDEILGKMSLLYMGTASASIH